jgi:hypothetical protein
VLRVLRVLRITARPLKMRIHVEARILVVSILHGDSLTNKRDFRPALCDVRTMLLDPSCGLCMSSAQATPDQHEHPKQTQIEQRPDFGNIAKRQTRPLPTLRARGPPPPGTFRLIIPRAFFT